MSTTKHTPGPWKVEYFVDHDEEGAVIEANGHGVATLYYRHGKYKAYLADQSEANAARIVACVNACEGLNPEAVPEMLEALESAEYQLQCDHDRIARSDAPFATGIRQILAKVRAAIAKAEGRE